MIFLAVWVSWKGERQNVKSWERVFTCPLAPENAMAFRLAVRDVSVDLLSAAGV